MFGLKKEQKFTIDDRINSVNGRYLIIGVPGSGCNIIVKDQICEIVKNTDDEVIVIDLFGNYQEIGEALGGQTVRIQDHKIPLNPFNIVTEYEMIPNQSDFIISFCSLLINQQLNSLEKSIIDWYVRALYCDIINNTSQNKKDNYRNYTLKDFYKLISNQEELEAMHMTWATEPCLNLFDNTGAGIKINSQLQVYDLSRSNRRQEIGALTCLKYALDRMKVNDQKQKRTWLFIPNIDYLLNNESLAEYLYSVWKSARMLGGFPTGTAGSVKSFLQSYYGTSTLSVSEDILLKQKQEDRYILAELYPQLKPKNISYITKAKIGQGLINKEGKWSPFKF